MATDPILFSPLRIGTKTAENRLVINAMEGCDADTAGNPTATTARRYERLAQGNAGVIVVEALSVVDENRKALRKETALIGSAYSLFRDGKNPFRGVKREESSFTYWAAKNIRSGVCDMVALGRQSLADPLLPAKLQAGKDDEVDWCTCCDNCIEFLIRQTPVGCATHEKEYTLELKQIRLQKGKLAEAEKHT